VFDSTGNLYVGGNGAIIKVTPGLQQSTWVPNSSTSPSGRNLTVDAQDNIYGTQDGVAAYKYSQPNGMVSNLGYTGTSGIGIVSAPDGTLYTAGYIADGTADTINKYDPTTETWSVYFSPNSGQYVGYAYQMA